MKLYFLFLIFLSIISFIDVKKASFIYVICFSVFLYFFPSTGSDYDIYRIQYLSGFFNTEFPFFHSHSILTAEPWFKFYTSFVRVVTNLDFESFLVMNFLVCIFLLKKGCSHIFHDDIYHWSVLFMAPVIWPTVCYWSVRSSISYFLIFLGVSYLFRENKYNSFIFIFSGCMIHSQYLLISFVVIVSRYVYDVSKRLIKFNINVYILNFIILCIFLCAVFGGAYVFVKFLNFLPSYKIISNKIHYFLDARDGLRITSFLSIFLFPFLLVRIIKGKKNIEYFLKYNEVFREDIFLYFLFVIVSYSFIMNIYFFNTPHLSGRLARFSDYYNFSILIPLFLLSLKKKHFVNISYIVFVLISPLIYNTLYHFF
jgi:hypothetical protein